MELEIEMEVATTSDPGMFGRMVGNRGINLKHVAQLVKSIETHGMLKCPILVNEDNLVIDGQHRLEAAKQTGSVIYYVVVEGYGLSQVHTLNLNQKNWSRRDFMEGFAEKGYEHYMILSAFLENNKHFTLSDCMMLCTNKSSHSSRDNRISEVTGQPHNPTENFEEGTWKTRDMVLAQINADKIKSIQTFYEGYNKSTFVGAMLSILKVDEFDFSEFMGKVKLQSRALQDCANRSQAREMIEEIYNFRRRVKVNLRF